MRFQLNEAGKVSAEVIVKTQKTLFSSEENRFEILQECEERVVVYCGGAWRGGCWQAWLYHGGSALTMVGV